MRGSELAEVPSIGGGVLNIRLQGVGSESASWLARACWGRAFTGPTPLGRELSASDIDVKRVEGGGAMPKKYRVEMTLLVDATNVVVDTDEHTENCEDDTQRQSSSSRGR